jgi:hypothetical protein
VASIVAALHAPALVLWVAGFLVVVRLLEDYVIYPRLIRRGIHLHPLAVILAVLAGAELGGVAGMFLAVPATAIAQWRFSTGWNGVAGMLRQSDRRRWPCCTTNPDNRIDVENVMKHQWIATGVLIIAAGVAAFAQQPPARGMSPDGSAQVQVLGQWVKPAQPAFTLGRESYQGGKWIEIKYGRPLQRGRDLFGSGANYGKAANDVGTATIPAPPVWRARAPTSRRGSIPTCRS